MVHELLVLVHGCLLLLLLRCIVDLSLQVGHSVGQVLKKLSPSLENCCIARSVCPCCCALPELLALPGRVTGG
jgi:hypothetical protein